jgi:broad specificity phosphatase PhoE
MPAANTAVRNVTARKAATQSEEASVLHLRNQKEGFQAGNGVCRLRSLSDSGRPGGYPGPNVLHSLFRAPDPAREQVPNHVHLLWGLSEDHQGCSRSACRGRQRADSDVAASSSSFDECTRGAVVALVHGDPEAAHLRSAYSSLCDDGVVTRLVLIRHAQPLVADGTPADHWPLTNKGKSDAGALERRLAEGSANTIVYTSPERKARETAELAFPSVAAHVREQLREVKRPWYAKPKEFTAAVAVYLKGEVVEGWESREDIAIRLASLTADSEAWERIVVITHGVLLTTWLHHEIGLEDPYGFWTDLRMPDAWEFDTEEKSLERLA